VRILPILSLLTLAGCSVVPPAITRETLRVEAHLGSDAHTLLEASTSLVASSHATLGYLDATLAQVLSHEALVAPQAIGLIQDLHRDAHYTPYLALLALALATVSLLLHRRKTPSVEILAPQHP
jgi:hypothetical protein